MGSSHCRQGGSHGGHGQEFMCKQMYDPSPGCQCLSALQGFNQPNSQTSPGSSLQAKRKTLHKTSMGAVTIQSTASDR